MVNYIRSEVQHGNEAPELSSREPFQDERFLKPFLEQDPLLYSLDDIFGPLDHIVPAVTNGLTEESSRTENIARDRIAELEAELCLLRKQFSAYRETIDQTLENRWNNGESSKADSVYSYGGMKTVPRDDDTHYFSSYSSNGEGRQLKKITSGVYR